MKTIVTGANGFLGSYLVKELIKNNIEVISVVHNKNSNIDSLPKTGNKIIYCDMSEIEDLTILISDRDIDLFYHFAWQGSAGKDRTDAKIQLENSIWTANCVRVAKVLGCRKFIGAGSIMEKETIAAIYSNGNKPGAAYIYGTGKLTAHSISKSIAATIGIDHIWGMITNAYGPGEVSPRFINTTLRKIINKDELQFTSAVQNYDFVYVTDVAKAFYHIGVQGKAFHCYLIGSYKAKPLKEFIIELRDEISPNLSMNFGDIPFTGVNLTLDNFNDESILHDTDYRPSVSFKDGIRSTMKWLKEMKGKNDSEISI